MNVSEYEFMGKTVRITYLSHRLYFIMSIDDRLHPKHFMTKAAALQEAYQILAKEKSSK